MSNSKDASASLEFYNVALSKEPNNPELLLHKAIALSKLERYTSALFLIDQALEIDPNLGIEAHIAKARVLLKFDRSNEALESISKVNLSMINSPKAWEAYLLKGDILRKLKKNDEALIAYWQATSLAS